jgi:6-pyruvoyl-tetrahydropterin synthase
MFEVGSRAAFRAFHRMPDQPAPENERHAHDYHAEVVAERVRLDARGMVCDLAVLTSALREVCGRLDGRDLADVCQADPVTVEVLASWIHGQLAGPLRDDGAETLAVRVWESEEAFGGLREAL